MEKNTNNQFNWRSFFSVLSALSFIGMTFTGIILFVVPPGRIANWTGWTLLALTKQQWIGLHIWLSLIFMVATPFHLYLNWKPFISYFRNKASRAFALRTEWALALVVCAAVTVCTLADVTPFSSLLVWNESIKHGWDSPRQRAPIPHAELLTLSELSKQVSDVSLENMLTNLKAQGIEAESEDIVLGKLAEAYNMTPSRLYDIAVGQAVAGEEHGQGGYGRGFGRMTLREYCEQMDLNMSTAIKKLEGAGLKAGPDMTIRSIADSAGIHPSEIRNVLESPNR